MDEIFTAISFCCALLAMRVFSRELDVGNDFYFALFYFMRPCSPSKCRISKNVARERENRLENYGKIYKGECSNGVEKIHLFFPYRK